MIKEKFTCKHTLYLSTEIISYIVASKETNIQYESVSKLLKTTFEVIILKIQLFITGINYI